MKNKLICNVFILYPNNEYCLEKSFEDVQSIGFLDGNFIVVLNHEDYSGMFAYVYGVENHRITIDIDDK